MKLEKRGRKGQSLVESVVTLGVVILLVTGLVVGTTSSLKYAQSSRTRSVVTQYASEGLELARKERDSGWGAFARAGIFCVGSSGAIPTEPCEVLENKYSRVLTYTLDNDVDPQIVTVVSSVTWIEGDGEKMISLQTTLTNWK
ncbi:MAG: hypothetical protein WAV51_01570 [Microgenomates group bacterium]